MDINQLSEKITKDIHVAVKKIYTNKKYAGKNSKINAVTKQLIQRRKQTNRDSAEYNNLCKKIKQHIRKDLRNHRTMEIMQVIENNKNLDVLKNKSAGKIKLTQIRNQQGTIVNDRKEILLAIEKFYSLYTLVQT